MVRVVDGAAVDMQVNPVGLTLSRMADEEHTRISDVRLEQLRRWHGTDETGLPPASTLQNLSHDTVAALAELQQARTTIATLRAAMGRAFWATDFRDLHAILLTALGPPPQDRPS